MPPGRQAVAYFRYGRRTVLCGIERRGYAWVVPATSVRHDGAHVTRIAAVEDGTPNGKMCGHKRHSGQSRGGVAGRTGGRGHGRLADGFELTDQFADEVVTAARAREHDVTGRLPAVRQRSECPSASFRVGHPAHVLQ